MELISSEYDINYYHNNLWPIFQLLEQMKGNSCKNPAEHETAGPQSETYVKLRQEQRISFEKYTVWSRSS